LASTSTVVVVVLVVFAMMAVMVVYASRYKGFPPNKAAVIVRGDRGKGTARYHLLKGTGKFVIPGIESVSLLDLNARITKFVVDKVPTSGDGGPVTVRLDVSVIWSITSDPQRLEEAAGGLVGRTWGENEILVKEHLDSAIRNAGPGHSAQEFQMTRDLTGAIGSFANRELEPLGLELRDLFFMKVRPQG
jgi:uncharacterized membrane protein YqiK